MTPIGICMHNTANSAPATNEINYMNSNNYQVSYHLAVDENQAIQGLPFDRNGWHAGDGNGQGNRKHIGIEIARSTSNDANVFAKAERRAAAVVAKLCQTYGWSTSNVLAHRDFASKNCPHRTNMGAFRKLVNEALAGKLTVEGPGTAGGTSSGSGGTTTTVKEEPASGTGTVTCDVLNVRSGPGTSNSVIGSLKRGNSVAVKAKSNGWYKVSYGSGTGWVCGDYLSVGQSSPAKAPAQSKPSSPSSSGGSAGRISGTGGAGVNVRSGAGTRYGRIGGLAEGASVTIVGQSNGWYKIKYGSGTGWVSSQFIKKGSGGGGGNGRIHGDRKLANNAIQVAREMGTTGWCATGVSRAIQRTYGIFVGGNGNQIDDNLPRSMFEQLNVGLGTALQYPGIILTWERTATRLGQIYGHTAITVGNGASSCSDYYEYNTTNNGRSGFKCFQRK